MKPVFDDIWATRGSAYVNNLWHYLASDSALRETVWRDVKAVMATPGTLDTLTKALIYAAVSIANSCPVDPDRRTFRQITPGVKKMAAARPATPRSQ